MQTGMIRWLRKGKTRYALLAAAAAFLCAGIFSVGAGGITDQWKYRIQQALFRYSGEMYMPGLFYAGNPEKEGAGEWVREKALAWMPLVSYVEDHIPGKETVEDEETLAKILESQANDENMVDEDNQADTNNSVNSENTNSSNNTYSNNTMNTNSADSTTTVSNVNSTSDTELGITEILTIFLIVIGVLLILLAIAILIRLKK